MHFYLELVLEGFRDAAQEFFATHAPALMLKHTEVLDRLSAVTLPHLVAENELAQRFRSEKYVVRMSRSGFGLLLGWLMEGSGGEAMGRDEGFGGEASKKGRATVRRILNDRIDVEGSLVKLAGPTPDTDPQLVLDSDSVELHRYPWVILGRQHGSYIVPNSPGYD